MMNTDKDDDSRHYWVVYVSYITSVVTVLILGARFGFGDGFRKKCGSGVGLVSAYVTQAINVLWSHSNKTRQM